MTEPVSPLQSARRRAGGLASVGGLARTGAAWGVVGLAVIIPFYRHTKSLEELFVYGSVGVVLLTALVGWLRDAPEGAGVRIRGGVLIWPIALAVATAAVSVVFSMARDASAAEFRKQILSFVMAYLAALNLMTDERWRRRAFWAFFLGGLAAAGFGIVAYYTETAVDAGRALGPAQSYTRSAMYFILWTPLMLAGLLEGAPANRWPRALVLIGIAMGWWLVVLTQTRGAMAVILLSTLALAAHRHWRWGAGLLIVSLLLAASVPSFRGRCLTTVRNLSDPNALLSDRLKLWRMAREVIAEHPLAGIGYGSEIFQQKAVRARYPMFNYKYQPHAHSFYLQAPCESGVLHLAGLLAFFAGFLVLAARGLGASGGRRPAGIDRAIVVGVFAGVASMLVYGVVGHFHERRVAMMMWYLIGLACAALTSARPPDSGPRVAGPRR